MSYFSTKTCVLSSRQDYSFEHPKDMTGKKILTSMVYLKLKDVMFHDFAKNFGLMSRSFRNTSVTWPWDY